MLRSLLTALLLATPLYAQEPAGGDEPMPSQPAPAAKDAPAAPAAAPAAPAAAPTAPAAAAPGGAAPASDGLVEQIIPNPPKVYGFGFGGAALGSLAISAILGGVALSRSGDQEGSVSSPPLYTRDLRDAGNEGHTLATTSYVFLGIGVALAITDVVMWYEIFRKPRTIKRAADGGKP